MADNNQAQEAVSGNVLLYTKPEPLDPRLHANVGIKRVDAPFKMAAKEHLLPLTVTEFGIAALSYPIIFVGDSYQPVVVMGLRDGDNLYFNEKGELEPEAYVPAYLRRLPFVFAIAEDNDTMVLCVDRGNPQVVDGGEFKLFDGDKPTPLVENAMEFCKDYETERRRTEEFVKLLRDLDLFEVKEATFTPRNDDGSAGQPQKIAEYYGVSEEKLGKLPDDKVLELYKNGAMSQIFAHIFSLQGWERLIIRAFSRAPQAANA
jgi:hypothetical protein